MSASRRRGLRPVRLYPGTVSPLAKGSPETIDMVVVREGTEGPYTGAGGVMRRGLPGLQIAVVQPALHRRRQRQEP